MERRFSLNMTHLPNPIAESTSLNLNGSTTTSNNVTRFPWGGTSISPKQRSNSSTCLNSSATTQHTLNHSGIAGSPRAKHNSSKIDPRIYADVRSKGLVSRIVQYHEKGVQLQRSMSASNLYSKPGQFPVVNLQKTKLPYRATQRNLSMTRIAPPEKSIFYGSALSSLQRSNSVICLQKSDEELSRENRPILHPPATEGDLAPTRSVLDVLKEISRKRINNDDTDLTNETNKKYCNRDYADGLYDANAFRALDMRNMGPGTTSLMQPTPSTSSYKRQREHMTSVPQLPQYAHIPAVHVPIARVPHPAQAPVQHQQQQQQTQRSPEQIAKKRLCSYNNDITSSLSSSKIHANKRKFYEQYRPAMPRSSPPSSEEYEVHKAKIQRHQPDLRFQQLSKTLSCGTPITPIPATPLNQAGDGLRSAPLLQTAPTSRSPSTAPATGVVPEPKRTVSEPIYVLNNERAAESRKAETNKPKLTLFNKNYEVSTENVNAEAEENDAVPDDECADIQFVKPKKSSAVSGSKNALIQRTQKSKLALMLSGLRGELYQDEEDEVDKGVKKSTTISPPITSSASVTATSAGDSTNLNGTLKAATSAVTATSTTITTTTANTTTMPAIAAIKPSTNIQFGVSPTKTTTTSTPPTQTTATSSASNNSSAASTTTTTTTASPVVGGFKFTPPSATSIVTPTTVSPVTSKSASPLVGIKLSNTNFNGPTPALGTAANKTVSDTIATGVGAVPQLQGFAFGALAKDAPKPNESIQNPNASSATTSLTTTTNAPATAAAPAGGFKFGLNTLSNTTSSSSALPTFGSFGKTEAKTATATISATTTTNAGNTIAPAFGTGTTNSTFGGFGKTETNAAPSSTPTATTTPTFSFKPPATSGNASANPVTAPTFSFGASTNTAVPSFGVNTAATTGTTAPVFGNANTFSSQAATNTNTNPITTTTAPPAFSISTTTTTANVAGNFFGTSTAPKAAFSFGNSQTTSSTATPAPNATTTANTNAGMFAFGGNTTAPKPAAAAGPFSFGGNQNNATANITTAAPQPTNNTFTFGGAQSTNTSNTTAPSTTNVFGFGGSNATAGAQQPVANTSSNIFGNAVTNTAAPNTNSSTAVKPAFAFGSTASQGAQPAAAPTFGNNSTPFAFGSTTNGGEPNKTDKPAPGGFSFGSSASTNSSSPNLFGNASTNNQTANTGIVKPSFSFGGNNMNNNPGQMEAAKSLFGTATNSNSNANNAFGAIAANTSNNATTNSNTFGSLAQQNKTFAFGASNNNGSTTNATPNIFGSAAPAPASNNNAGGFAFGNTNNNNSGITNASNAANKPAFSFTGSNNLNQSNAAAPFSFGQKPNDNSAVTATKTFSFGSAPAANNSATNIFGNVGKPETQAAAAAPFSFSAGNNAGAANQPAASGNLFAPPANMLAPGERHIRRGTRRLQKS